ncbi:hypothetical protein J1614_003397 [Plenodomus biglobosus]|nr:hypothetical protein J1614_003397 [Plenodomus biglobosus]
MTRTLSVRSKKTSPTLSSLTEENLRAHSCPPTIQQQSTHCNHHIPTKQTSTFKNHFVEEDEEDEEDEQSVAMRRVASLQALKAYGGCFASGFLAMQQPLPWPTTSMSETRSVRTSSTASSNDFEYPKAESDTESIVDVQEIQTGRRRSWRELGRKRVSMMKFSRG